jgi:cytochrome c peroxidase
MKAQLLSILLLVSITIVLSCSDNNPDGFIPEEKDILDQFLNLPENDFDYSIQLPEHVRHLIPAGPGSEHDPTRDKIATLGRVLFYDTRLSTNEKVSCATCHDQKKGFADNMVLSEGFNGEVGHRNSIALATTVGFEASYGGGDPGVDPDFGGIPNIVQFSWDDMVPDIAEQSRLAIESEVEMGMKMSDVVERLKREQFYGILFKNAFGTLEVTEENTLAALQVFINTIASVDTKFDNAMDDAGLPDPFIDFPGFSNQENLGKQLFNENCTTCHSFNHATTFISIANNGLDLIYEDNGKGAKTGLEEEMALFKIPFLRNIALTAPYMHDGRFATLEEVIDHYSSGIKDHPNLSSELKEFSQENPLGTARKFNFSGDEKSAIIAYLHTLTDLTLASEEKYADPFIR